MGHKGLFNDGEDLLRNVTTCRKKMTGKGDACVSQPRMPVFAIDSSNQSSFETSTKAAAIDDRNASTLMSVATSNVPIHNIDVVANVFGVPLKSCKDIDEFTKDLEADKYEWDVLLKESQSMPQGAPTADDNLSSKVSPNDPIVQSVIINEKPTSYIGVAGGSKPEPSLEDVLENGPWMIHNSPIILKTWSMNTCLCKEELTRILVWVKIHDVPIQVFLEDGLSIIASQIGKPIMLDSYTTSMCIDL
ncbi:zinc knuckle CX2CX4HX4C containing protein [Tanacetum coccineum]